MASLILWYLVVIILGWLTFPIAFRLFTGLSDRGFAFAKAMGLLLWGFIFWLLACLHVLGNNIVSIVASMAILTGLSFLQMRKGWWKPTWTWVRDNKKIIITVEIIFLSLFLLWTVVRAANPDINGTEKPMELAFINAISHSPSFPPNDPWLSGYSISYYYFGYVMISMLIRLTGVSAGVGYNLAGALWFALTGIGAYGILFNLIRMYRKKDAIQVQRRTGFLGGLLGPFFILIVSNLEGFLDFIHKLGWFWTINPDGTATSKFWSWLGILDLNSPATQTGLQAPFRYMWWWRASRIITQYDLAGNWKEIIDEFPFFSYLLADLHPHVLAMPFVLLAISLGLNFFIQWKEESFKRFRLWNWAKKWDFWLVALVFGGLAFLNTWDFLFYIALLSAVFFYCRYRLLHSLWSGVWDFIRLAVTLVVAGVLLYAPFFISLQSQAKGPTPSMNYFSRGVQFWVMFAPLLLPIFAFCVWCLIKNRKRIDWASGLVFSSLVVLGLWFISYAAGGLLASFSTSGNTNLRQAGIDFLNVNGGVPAYNLFVQSLANRFKAPGTWLTLYVLIFMVWCLIGATARRGSKHAEFSLINHTVISEKTHDDGMGFLLLLILLGSGLTVVPEFIYLKDVFGWPINTYFKFYFEAWIVWGLAAAFCSYILWERLRGWRGILFKLLWILFMVLSLFYPVLSIPDKTVLTLPSVLWLVWAVIAIVLSWMLWKRNVEKIHISIKILWSVVILASISLFVISALRNPGYLQKGALNLDGLQFRKVSDPDEEDAIRWLSQAQYGYVAEAIGGQYSEYARVSTESGLPAVLGWPGHEDQWRGGRTEIGSRETDVQDLYQANSWQEAQAILDEYNIRYIFVGSLERIKYSSGQALLHVEILNQNLPVVFQNASVTIYEYQK
jgi:YYY domain-containing protein